MLEGTLADALAEVTINLQNKMKNKEQLRFKGLYWQLVAFHAKHRHANFKHGKNNVQIVAWAT